MSIVSRTTPKAANFTRLITGFAVLSVLACATPEAADDDPVTSAGVSSQGVPVDSGSTEGDEQPIIVGAVPERERLMKPAPNPAWNTIIWQKNHTYEVAPGTYIFRYRYTQSLFLVTDDGVIVTDPISPKAARVYRDAIREVTDQPVRYVVYSHDHWDHAAGGAVFKEEGATFVAHENCLKSWRKIPNPAVVTADQTISGDHRIELGGQVLDLLYFGPNHGECMLVMRPNEGEFLFIVDLVIPGNMPNVWMPDYDLVEWIRTLKEIESLADWTTIIPGHGPIIAHRSALSERRRYLELLLERAFQSHEQGGSLNAMVDRIKMPEFAHLRGYEENLRGNASRAIAVPYMGF